MSHIHPNESLLELRSGRHLELLLVGKAELWGPDWDKLFNLGQIDRMKEEREGFNLPLLALQGHRPRHVVAPRSWEGFSPESLQGNGCLSASTTRN